MASGLIMEFIESGPTAAIPDFPFGDIDFANVVDVYDADTLTIVFKYGRRPIKMKLRVHGIDAPEIRSKTPILSAHAVAGREFVKKLFNPDEEYRVELLKWDKYGGRVVGNIWVAVEAEAEVESLSDILIFNGYAVPYDGRAKKSDDEMIELLALS